MALTLLQINETDFVVDQGYGALVVEFHPLDLTGKTPQEAFCLGMAYALLENRGIPLDTAEPEQGSMVVEETVTEEI